MTGLKVAKILSEIKFEGALNELEAENCFQTQSITHCLKLTLVFLSNNGIREKFLPFNFILLLLTKLLFCQEDLIVGYHFVNFWDFSDIF